MVDATDQELFEQMERENRSRSDLSAWEQGAMYRRALDDGLYPSLRQLAESLDVDPSLVRHAPAGFLQAALGLVCVSVAHDGSPWS